MKINECTRVLDLTDEKGFLCGKILADLGADVIKVEKPGGDTSRLGPFYKGNPYSESSLYWFAYNLNKRGITLNIGAADGQELFKKLVKTSDIVLESFHPQYLDSLGLGYSDLSVINPRIIMTSITPFGCTGPYMDYKATDIVVMAMGGLAFMTGSMNGCPVRISSPQAFLLAAAHGAAATMIAHYYQIKTGKGQHVDISAQACVAGTLANALPLWELGHVISKRQGPFMVSRAGEVKTRTLWPCKDGHVIFAVIGGRLGENSNSQLAEWINNEEMAPELIGIDWSSLDMAKQNQEEQDLIEKPIAKFFMKHTKTELYEGALKRGIMLVPVSSIKDIIENVQLEARDFWIDVEHPELKSSIKYPGPFFKSSRKPFAMRHRGHLIGEHNVEVYEGELGMSKDAMILMKQAGVI